MILDRVTDLRWFRDDGRRRLTFAIVAAVLVIFCVWPRHYLAKAELAPEESTGGLSAMLSGGATGGGLNLSALLGQHQSIEGELAVARSHAVAGDVIARLRRAGRGKFQDTDKAEVKLRHKVNIEAVRGSVIQIKVQDANAAFARALASDYADAIRDRLGAISLAETSEKRTVAENRLSDATVNLAKAQADIAHFRAYNKLAVPEAQLGAAVTQLALIQANLQAKQVQLGALLTFNTEDNVQVRAVRAEIASLQSQISSEQTRSPDFGAPNLAGMAAIEAQYYDLYRNEKFAQVLYEIYSRYMESTTIDEMSAGNSVSLIEPAYVEPSRQLNVWAVALLMLVLMAAVTSEFYIVRPPVGRKMRDDTRGAAV